MYFTSGQDRAFERLMQEKPGFDHYDGGGANAPEDCGSCRFYRPDWKYQYCVYAECPYQPGKLTALAAVKFTVKGADDDMAVFRVEKNKGYTAMSNHHLRNKALSLKAKGLLSQMLSLPEDWDYTLPSTLWARDLYDQMHIRSDFRKWFPRMCQYGFIEDRDYEYMPRVRLQDEGGRTVQRYVKDYRITQDMAKKLCKLHHTAVGAAYHPQPFDWDALLGLLHKKPPRRSSYEAQLSDSDSLVPTTQIAKEYGCGAKVFNRLLHLHGIQYRANGQWVLYSEHHRRALFFTRVEPL